MIDGRYVIDRMLDDQNMKTEKKVRGKMLNFWSNYALYIHVYVITANFKFRFWLSFTIIINRIRK